MFSLTFRSLCFAHLAVSCATKFKEEFGADSDTSERVQLWIDDTEEERLQYEEHIKSPEYKELHKPAMTTSAMGLFGGEPGFEKSHRVWVDPDRPQMKHIYNQTALAKNLRYTRYGYFKRDMHLLDIDKLVRHARMLPTPNRLLSDFLYQRVPLPDKSCAAILRYQRDQLEMLEEWRRMQSFSCAEEIFERLCVTNIPPVEVGVETHAEMIRCCAVCKEWRKGYDIYLTRAREVEEDDYTNAFVLNTSLFDAVLELCVACEKPKEGLQVMREVIERHLRPRSTILDKALILVSIAEEQLLEGIGKGADADGDSAASDESQEKLLTTQGMDLWTLYDFFKIQRTTQSFEAYIRMTAMTGKALKALEALHLAEVSDVKLSLECYYWVLYAIRDVPHLSDYVMDLFSQLHPRGLSPDYVVFTLAFGFCALNADGELALALYTQYFIHTNINPTPEMTLLFCQACAQCENPSTQMLSSCTAMLDRLEETGSVKDLTVEIYDQYMELAASLGAVSLGFSRLKVLVSYGKDITTRMLNSLLLAVSNTEGGTSDVSFILEVYHLFRFMHIPANQDTLHALAFCQKRFDLPPEVAEWASQLLARMNGEVPQDGEETVEFVNTRDEKTKITVSAPHRIRQLQTEWKLRPRDTMLRRFGQNVRLPPEVQVGSMLGSVVPFGRSPGERRV